jgi:U32 family peptidase
MKIITTFYDISNIKTLSAYADGFLIGCHKFAARLTRSFDTSEMITATQLIKSLNKEVFLVINQLFNDQQLEALNLFLKQLNLNLFSGIIIADLGVIPMLLDFNQKEKIIYHPETLLTNYHDFNDLCHIGIKGAFVAKEITLEDVITIASHKQHELFMIGHGHLSMFYSKRRLIENFLEFSELDLNLSFDQDLKLIEEHRKDQAFPILEDTAGTHVFSSNVFSSIKKIDILKTHVDYLMIDTIFKDDLYALSILKMYQTGKLDLELKKEFEETYKETWDEGFFNKKTIYRQIRDNES